ncbi:MAG: DNA-directed RNA polymerase subunit alpha C-terminal domain-containing protein [Planctomycetota bacterium]
MNDPLDVMIGGDDITGDTELAEQHLTTANTCISAGDRVAAAEELRKAVTADPGHAEALFRLAYELDLLGEEEEAIALYERCVERKPAHINALMNLAILYEDSGNYVASEKSLRQVLETAPNHPRAKLFMKDVQASKDMMVDEEHDRDLAKRNALMDTPVTDFELSVRARNCLKKMNIRTLGDLLRVTEAELMGYKNFGEASLNEIKEMLATKGLRLGQGLDEHHRKRRQQLTESLRGAGTNDAVLNKSVADLGLSVRARKALQLLGIHTLGDLAARTEAELMGVKNFGATSLDEVKIKLVENNLTLRELEF